MNKSKKKKNITNRNIILVNTKNYLFVSLFQPIIMHWIIDQQTILSQLLCRIIRIFMLLSLMMPQVIKQEKLFKNF